MNNRLIFTIFILIIASGTLGYSLIEGWSFLDSLYMTITTLTTVGYGEVHPLSSGGRVFTMVLLVFGLGTVLFVLSNFVGTVVQTQTRLRKALVKRRMENQLERLENHIILAGFGRTGQIVAKDLAARNVSFVVIEKDESLLSILREKGLLFLAGSAYDEELLKQAGVDRARGFVSVVSTDADNAFAVMTVKGLNPKIHIVTRAVDDGNTQRLMRAGAARVISPYRLGGTRIAQSILSPAVVDFFEVMEDSGMKDIEMADVEVSENSEIAHQKLGSTIFSELSLIVVGIRKPKQPMVYKPSLQTIVEPLDHLVVVGHSEDVARLARMMAL